MTVAGDECGVSGVGQCDQVVVFRIRASDRGWSRGIRHEFPGVAKQAHSCAYGIELEIAPELLSAQYRLQLPEKLPGHDEIEASGACGKQRLRRSSFWRDQR